MRIAGKAGINPTMIIKTSAIGAGGISVQGRRGTCSPLRPGRIRRKKMKDELLEPWRRLWKFVKIELAVAAVILLSGVIAKLLWLLSDWLRV
jgi:hypothetical protein